MRRLCQALGLVLMIALSSTALARQTCDLKKGDGVAAEFVTPGRKLARPKCDLKQGDHSGGGYVGNIPTEWLGFCFFSTKSDGVGFYIDLKFSVPMIYGGDDLYDNISIHQAEGWGDSLIGMENGWISGNVGLTGVLSSSVAFYAGVGYATNTDYRNYYDAFHILGTNGKYWVEGKTEESLNVLGGLFVVLGESWGLQVGGETSPRGVTAGVFFIN